MPNPSIGESEYLAGLSERFVISIGQSQEVKPEIVIDCDPGHDDAIAICVAAQRARLIGVTTVAGNLS